MNVVIYEANLNPLTIIDLPLAALEQGARMGRVHVQLDEPPQQPSLAAQTYEVHTFTLEFMTLHVRDGRGFCLVTREAALKKWLGTGTTREFLRKRDKLARGLRSVLARGVGGH